MSSEYDLERARMLVADLREQVERRTAERDEALAVAKTQQVASGYGRALLEVAAVLRRLRRTPCPTMALGFTWIDVASAVASELGEVCREPEGSPAAQAECADLVAASIHLAIANGMRDADLLAALQRWAEKIKARLDHVDGGGTWKEAKAMEREA